MSGRSAARGRNAGARLLACGAVIAAAALCVVLLRWPPDRAGFYPVCPLYRYLHVLCPGCGGTRALAALLRGDLREALRWNALFVALLPAAGGYAAVCGRRAFGAAPFRWPEIPAWAAYGLLCASLLFAAVRNLALGG